MPGPTATCLGVGGELAEPPSISSLPVLTCPSNEVRPPVWWVAVAKLARPLLALSFSFRVCSECCMLFFFVSDISVRSERDGSFRTFGDRSVHLTLPRPTVCSWWMDIFWKLSFGRKCSTRRVFRSRCLWASKCLRPIRLFFVSKFTTRVKMHE